MCPSIVSHGPSPLKLVLKFSSKLRVDVIKASVMGAGYRDGWVNTVLDNQAQGPGFGSQAPM